MTVLGYTLALLIGLLLGALGGGGAIVTVPLLVYVFGVAVKSAVPMSLIVVGLTSVVGVYRHSRAGSLDIRTAVAFGPTSMLGAVLGTEAAFTVSARVQLTVFAVLVLVAGALMLRGRGGDGGPGEPSARKASAVLVGLIGTMVGFLTGFIGVGGGFMYVPALALLAGLPMRTAVGTSLALIALSCAAGVARYIGRVDLDWSLAATITGLAFVGVVLGTVVAHRVPQRVLRRAFAIFLLVLGAFVLVRGEAGSRGPEPETSPVRGDASAASGPSHEKENQIHVVPSLL